MKTWRLYLIVALLVTLMLLAGVYAYIETQADMRKPDIFFGVDAAYDDMTSLKARVNQVKSFTNFFIIGSYGITFNETRVNEFAQYLYDNGLSFVVFAHTNRDSNNPYQLNQSAWSIYAKQTWGERFVGLYCYDEPGGHQVDHDPVFSVVQAADNYSDAANKFVAKIKGDALLDFIPDNTTLMTSDYALYDFDYKSGYDVILAELAWNHSRPINIALARGAATAYGKDWGVMITYTYDSKPYLASPQQIYNDLVLAYQNGAKYFVVFDYAKNPVTNATHGILDKTRLDAMQRFWDYVKHNPTPAETSQRTAYVLPADYAYGFRGPADKIWGLWGPDQLSSKVWNDANTLTSQYGNGLDIVYEDVLQTHAYNYSRLIFWNGTIKTPESPRLIT
jgi:hypothetical protein